MSVSVPNPSRRLRNTTRLAAPQSGHIPRYFVRPADGALGATTLGAHRFPRAPTPVLGATVALLGLPAVDAACRPYARAQVYGCARITPAHPRGDRPEELRSARFGKQRIT